MSLDSIKYVNFLKSLIVLQQSYSIVIALEQFAAEPHSKLKFISCEKPNGVLFLSVLSSLHSKVLPTTFNFKSCFLLR
jgi:hypothetical protein